MIKKILLLALSAALTANGPLGESGQAQPLPCYTADAITPAAQAAPLSGEKQYPDAVVGIWQAGPWVGAGFLQVYWFEENSVYTWANSEAEGAERLRYATGEWYVADDTLYLCASAFVQRQGGTEIPGYASMINDRIGGEMVRIDLTPENRAVEAYPLTPLDEAFFSGFQMGGIRLYRVAAPWEEKKAQLAAVRDNDPSFLERQNEMIKAREAGLPGKK